MDVRSEGAGRSFRFVKSAMTLLIVGAATCGVASAEEKRTGTIELLITMPVTEAQVVVGKFLGVFGLYAVLLALTLPYPISIATLGDLDWGPVIGGYVGALLLSLGGCNCGTPCGPDGSCPEGEACSLAWGT